MTRGARHPLRLHYVPVAFGSRDSVTPKGVESKGELNNKRHTDKKVNSNCH
jgi:hypothetical protein